MNPMQRKKLAVLLAEKSKMLAPTPLKVDAVAKLPKLPEDPKLPAIEKMPKFGNLNKIIRSK